MCSFNEQREGKMKKDLDTRLLIGRGLVTAAVIGLLLISGLSWGANEDEHQLMIVGTGYLWHEGSATGVSKIPVPSGVVPVQAMLQAVGGNARFCFADELDGSSGVSGWVLEENQSLELISADQIENWGFCPMSTHTTGVTVWYVIEGRN
jgi:hypothetical protein